jgi:hypothetical protein
MLGRVEGALVQECAGRLAAANRPSLRVSDQVPKQAKASCQLLLPGITHSAEQAQIINRPLFDIDVATLMSTCSVSDLAADYSVCV